MGRYRPKVGNGAVLVVEDDPQSRDMLRRALTRQGWEVVEAPDGRKGLASLDQVRPALILLDLMMPEMDGFEFMDELLRRPEGPQIPVIVVTAKELTDQDRQRLNGDVTQILQKGAFSPDDLVREVRRLLQVRAPLLEALARAPGPLVPSDNKAPGEGAPSPTGTANPPPPSPHA
jgi:CheY-like chemotaxis protein